jgi:hypothetical protein
MSDFESGAFNRALPTLRISKYIVTRANDDSSGLPDWPAWLGEQGNIGQSIPKWGALDREELFPGDEIPDELVGERYVGQI